MRQFCNERLTHLDAIVLFLTWRKDTYNKTSVSGAIRNGDIVELVSKMLNQIVV